MKILVISAGKNTRFGMDKALAKINGIENILNTYNKLQSYANGFYIATQKKNVPLYKKILPDVKYLPIRKSEGSGQGARDALKQMRGNPYLLITWGDMYFKDTKFMKNIFVQQKKDRFNILVEHEKKPYTSYYLDRSGYPTRPFYSVIMGFRLLAGYGDRGVFLSRKKHLLDYLKELKKNCGEYRLLDVIKDMYKFGEPANLIIARNTGIKTFNTKKELEKIVNERSKNRAI